MTGPLEDADDDALMAELAGLLAARAEPPSDLVDAAKALFTWRTVDAELAALTFDSLIDDGVALSRADEPPRTLTFEATGLTIDIEVDAGPAGRRVLGQLLPAQPAELELRSGGEAVTGHADEFGRFALTVPATRRPVNLRCRLQDGSVVQTSGMML